MSRYFIHLSYNGSRYHGWQFQQNAHTVQAEINEKLSLLLNENVNIVGCGRTDAGVHARDFYAHFDLISDVSDTVDLCYKLDKFLPGDIHIFQIFKVEADLHARFSALSRTYSYYISREKDPFGIETSYYYHGPLDFEAMQLACKYLLDYTDFTSFSKLNTQTKTNDCAIQKAFWEQDGYKLTFTIQADRFLRNMVRAIVGTCLEIGKGKILPDEMKKIIEARDRSEAGFSVPAHGLFLEKVEYNFENQINFVNV